VPASENLRTSGHGAICKMQVTDGWSGHARGMRMFA
jgi:hypothetical protein